MKAMLIKSLSDMTRNPEPLTPADFPDPVPGDHEVLIKVSVCGVCHTELDEIEGRTPPPHLPVIPGHQVVGEIIQTGKLVKTLKQGDRVGVAWIFSSCGKCNYCLSGNENLCPDFKATGRDENGGYAEYMKVPENFACPVPEVFSDSQAAPLLCAGAVGYRSLKLTNIRNGENIALTGFGASGHLVLKMIKYKYPDSKIYVFARNIEERKFAYDLGANWTGDTAESPPEKLSTIIDTTPVWRPVVEAMKNLLPGGRLVINAIRKVDTDKDYLLNLKYHDHLWMEKEIKSVANVARNDVKEFLDLASRAHIIPEITEYRLKEANHALMELKQSKIRGAKVLII